MRIQSLRIAATALCLASFGLAAIQPARAEEAIPAKQLFGNIKLPTKGRAAPVGFYAKGCLAGGVAVPADGPTWQAIHLSRNRRWGHPNMVALVEKLSRDAAARDGWPGLLVGDLSQPRGGPMLTGHSSHQVGLDVDIWLTPMPQRQLSYEERETIAEYSMLKKDTLRVDPNRWTPAHAAVIMRAASYPEVERIFVHPGIKKKLCDSWKGNRANLGKVRPYYGHHYHFHIRIKCPQDATNCQAQPAVGFGDGCGKELAWWLSDKPWGKPKTDARPVKPRKPVKPRFAKLSDLPQACAIVLKAPAVPSELQATATASMTAFAEEAIARPAVAPAGIPNPDFTLPENGPMPLIRPLSP